MLYISVVFAVVRWLADVRHIHVFVVYELNGYRYGHSYYGMRIGTCFPGFRMVPFLMTSNSYFKFTLQQQLQWQTDWKSYMICRLVPLSVTLI